MGWENLLESQLAFTYSKLTIETLGQGVKYVFEHILHLVLVFLLLTLNIYLLVGLHVFIFIHSTLGYKRINFHDSASNR